MQTLVAQGPLIAEREPSPTDESQILAMIREWHQHKYGPTPFWQLASATHWFFQRIMRAVENLRVSGAVHWADETHIATGRAPVRGEWR